LHHTSFQQHLRKPKPRKWDRIFADVGCLQIDVSKRYLKIR
jgi:hypothetical protein